MKLPAVERMMWYTRRLDLETLQKSLHTDKVLFNSRRRRTFQNKLEELIDLAKKYEADCLNEEKGE